MPGHRTGARLPCSATDSPRRAAESAEDIVRNPANRWCLRIGTPRAPHQPLGPTGIRELLEQHPEDTGGQNGHESLGQLQLQAITADQIRVIMRQAKAHRFQDRVA
jgi:hypothetical protein